MKSSGVSLLPTAAATFLALAAAIPVNAQKAEAMEVPVYGGSVNSMSIRRIELRGKPYIQVRLSSWQIHNSAIRRSSLSYYITIGARVFEADFCGGRAATSALCTGIPEGEFAKLKDGELIFAKYGFFDGVNHTKLDHVASFGQLDKGVLKKTDSPEQCTARPSKTSLEKLIGKPGECSSSEGKVPCYEKVGIHIIPEIDLSDTVESILISTSCVGIRGLAGLAEQIVPKSNRGKFLKTVAKTTLGDCRTIYEEEYECLTMEYFQNNCQGCVPAAIKAIWKR